MKLKKILLVAAAVGLGVVLFKSSNGVVKSLNVETERGVNVSGAETIMQQLKSA